MDLLLKYYRMLTKLCEEDADPARRKLAQALTESDPGDLFVEEILDCAVSDDWIVPLEEGLLHAEAAIAENRSFLKNEGTVVPIERVRKVSKESVFHLARHSSLISHVEENGTVMPEKLNVSEKLDDNSVYENRFLFTALTTFRAFVEVRLRGMQRADRQRRMQTRLQRSFDCPDLQGELVLQGQSLLRSGPADPQVMHVREIFEKIGMLLRTDLMRVMAGQPAVKPPITRTNVLKTDLHFKGVLAAYEYILAYEQRGYEILNRKEKRLPLDGTGADLLAAAGLLQTTALFACDPDLRARMDAKLQKLAQREARGAYAGFEESAAKILEQLQDGTLDAAQALTGLCRAMQEERDAKKEEDAEKDRQLEEIRALYVQSGRSLSLSAERIEALQNERLLLLSQLDALRREYGRIDPSDLTYTEEERFNELEREYEYLGKLLDEQWKKTKKQIRKRVLRKMLKDDETNAAKTRKDGED